MQSVTIDEVRALVPCVRCGYLLAERKPSPTRCPECGLYSAMCSECGSELPSRGGHSFCPACGAPTTTVLDANLYWVAALPWLKAPGAYWLPDASVARRYYPFALLSLVALAIGFTVACSGTRCMWHFVAHHEEGVFIWSWRGDITLRHWLALSQDSRPLGDRLSAWLYLAYSQEMLHVGAKPPRRITGQVSEYFRHWQIAFPNGRETAHGALLMCAPYLAMLLVIRYLPPVGLRSLAVSEATLALVRVGFSRLVWLFPGAAAIHGAWLTLVGIYDMSAPWFGGRFLGAWTLGLDIMLPVLVVQFGAIRLVRADGRGYVFSDRNLATMHMGLALMVALVVAGGMSVIAVGILNV